jgi:hypothetical protein
MFRDIRRKVFSKYSTFSFRYDNKAHLFVQNSLNLGDVHSSPRWIMTKTSIQFRRHLRNAGQIGYRLNEHGNARLHLCTHAPFHLQHDQFSTFGKIQTFLLMISKDNERYTREYARWRRHTAFRLKYRCLWLCRVCCCYFFLQAFV